MNFYKMSKYSYFRYRQLQNMRKLAGSENISDYECQIYIFLTGVRYKHLLYLNSMCERINVNVVWYAVITAILCGYVTV